MPRPPRPQLAGGIYHITSRGNRRQETFLDDVDRRLFLHLLDITIARFLWRCHAYCLMSNHVHLVVETSQANISAGMQYLLGRYGQAFNTRHELTGHLFQGRFYSTLIETDPHLLVVVRYVLLNPVRAGLCDHPGDYDWSSYCATVGMASRPARLHVKLVLGIVSPDRDTARQMFAEFVCGALARASP